MHIYYTCILNISAKYLKYISRIYKILFLSFWKYFGKRSECSGNVSVSRKRNSKHFKRFKLWEYRSNSAFAKHYRSSQKVVGILVHVLGISAIIGCKCSQWLQKFQKNIASTPPSFKSVDVTRSIDIKKLKFSETSVVYPFPVVRYHFPHKRLGTGVSRKLSAGGSETGWLWDGNISNGMPGSGRTFPSSWKGSSILRKRWREWRQGGEHWW